MTLDVCSGLVDDDLGGLAERMDAAPDVRNSARRVGAGPLAHIAGGSRQADDLQMRRWGGWGSNPRPRDYESHALTS